MQRALHGLKYRYGFIVRRVQEPVAHTVFGTRAHFETLLSMVSAEFEDLVKYFEGR